MTRNITAQLSGVWSAAPTPFNTNMTVDLKSLKRMVDHHVRLGVNGLFMAGTNGEGPWMTDEQRRKLIAATAKYVDGRMLVAVQVTDNSPARIVDNARAARDDGADIAVIAAPYFQVGNRPDLQTLYTNATRNSPLPVGIYDRGKNGPVYVPDAVMRNVVMEKKVVMVKDSSLDPKRRALLLNCRKKRPELRLLNGGEFDCVEYLAAGYNGLLLGGCVFNGYLAGRIIEAVVHGDMALAEKLQHRMNRIMYTVYGGRKIKCWLSGEKLLLVELGIFRTWKNHLDYPLTDSCVKAIKRLVKRETDVLMPYLH